jgi:hypothetical protein
VLGSSRGPQDLGRMVDTLVRLDVGLLFVIGGDGGLRGASAIAGEIARRRLSIGVVGVPKTIDNDLQWTWRSFGFETAVDAARTVLAAARGGPRRVERIGLVKLMGRHSGFIAANATLASGDVNFCLVPEVPFTLEGPTGLLAALEARLAEKHHALVVVAEGAGQNLMADGGTPAHDASGNVKLKDIGAFLRDRIAAHLAEKRLDGVVRYIDPSYTIRSMRRTPSTRSSAWRSAARVHAGSGGPHGRARRRVEPALHPRADPGRGRGAAATGSAGRALATGCSSRRGRSGSGAARSVRVGQHQLVFGRSAGSISPCRSQPTRASHVRATAVGGAPVGVGRDAWPIPRTMRPRARIELGNSSRMLLEIHQDVDQGMTYRARRR